MILSYRAEIKKNPSLKEQIKILKEDLERVKVQRNKYERELLLANRELNRVKTELQHLENYINRSKPSTNVK